MMGLWLMLMSVLGLWLPTRAMAQSGVGTITTVAGTGTPRFYGDGRQATQADLWFPYGVFVDAGGVLYIADRQNSRIRRVDTDGVISTIKIQTNQAGHVAVTSDGTVLIASSASIGGITIDAAGSLFYSVTGIIGFDTKLNQSIYESRIQKRLADGRITTVAGVGQGFGGDGGPAAKAQMKDPMGLAFDSAGNLYVADSGNHRIRKISTDGIITTVGGTGSSVVSGDGGPATSAGIPFPRGLAVDAAGSIFITITQSRTPSGFGAPEHLVRKIGADGIITTVAGTGTGGFSGDGGPAQKAELNEPSGLAVDKGGALYIADYRNHRIRKVLGVAQGEPGWMPSLPPLRRPSGVISTVAGPGVSGNLGDGGPATQAYLGGVEGITIGRDGSLYIADPTQNRVRRVGPDGIIRTVAGTGTRGFSGDGGPATQARLSGPSDVVVDAAGYVYIGDSGNFRVRRVSPDGVITTYAGTGVRDTLGDGGPASQATLDGTGLAMSGGFLYIYGGQNIRRVGPGGIIRKVIGGGYRGPAYDFDFKASYMAVDAVGNLYISETTLHRIRRISGGVITAVAGTGEPGFSGDEGLAIKASVTSPGGLAVDRTGAVFFVDQGNRIRRIGPDGIITTVAGTGFSGFSGDGWGALWAELRYPADIALAENGDLYINDEGNGRIRKVSAKAPVFAGNEPLVVNSVGDEPDADPNDGVADADLVRAGSQTTLRAAIQEAGYRPRKDFVTFDILASTPPVIQVGSPLPEIRDALEIDATTQPETGRVILDGTKVGGQASGLRFAAGDNAVRGLTVRKFGGDGIYSISSGQIRLEGVEASDNGGWGVEASGRLFISTNPFTGNETYKEVSRFRDNGTGGEGGGVRSLEQDIHAHYVEALGNQGPGILAKNHITLSGVKADSNRGPGIQSLTGDITVNPATGDSNSASGNAGPGMMTGTNLLFGEKGLGGGIAVKTDIQVRDNAGWGIYSQKYAEVNSVEGIPYSERVSRISGNGVPGKEMYIVDVNGRLSLLKGMDAGGVAASRGEIRANRVEADGNHGPGLVAWSHVHLRGVKADSNRGPGIQSLTGDISFSPVTGERNSASNNAGPGMMTGTNLLFGEKGRGGGIGIKTDIQVRDNAGWGIYSQKYVEVNSVEGIPYSERVSRISGNGVPGKEMYIVDVDGRLALLKGMDAGGIAASRGGIKACRVAVERNRGPGMVAWYDVYLRGAAADSNRGPGIQSLNGGISFTPVTGENNSASNNAGPGLLTTPSTGAKGDIHALTSVQVRGNAGWGIQAERRNVLVNAWEGGLRADDNLSAISGNGVGSREQFAMGPSGRVISWENSGGGGVRVGNGSFTANRVEVSDNGGPGIQASRSVTIWQGKVCRNQGRGIAASRVYIEPAQVCENREGGIYLTAAPASSPKAVVMQQEAETSRISGSHISGNLGEGVRFEGGAPLSILRSNLIGNAGFGVNNLSPSLSVSARDNWWGDATGPSVSGSGKGDRVGGKVEVSGWRSGPVVLVLTADRETVPVDPARQDSVRVSVQNWQKADDAVEVRVTDTLKWLKSPASLSLPLQAGGGQTVLQFAVPTALSPGAVNEVRVTAASKAEPSAADTVLIRLQALLTVDLSATPDTITADGATTSGVRARLSWNGVLQTRNDSTRITFRIVDGQGVLSDSVAVTRGGVASTALRSATAGRITVEAVAPVVRRATAAVEIVSRAVTPDFNGDGTVGFDDFFLFAAAFGSKDPMFDLNGSGAVDFDDFFLFASAFGSRLQAGKPGG